MITIKHLLGKSAIQKCFLNIYDSIGVRSLHTTNILYETSEVPSPPVNIIPKRGRRDPPSDFLPFPWTRKTKNNLLEDSGDLIKFNEIDPTSPKPDFEYSEELKTANDTVKNYFSVATATYKEQSEACRRQTVKRVQRHPLDFDSLEVRIAERTVGVRSLFEFKSRAPKSEVYMTRVLLPIMIQKRNGLLRRLWILDQERFDWLVKELKLYLLYIPFGVQRFRYTRKNDMRRLTKAYCEKMINEKRSAYHETLKKEQELFKEEKAKALAWIEEEEKAIKDLDEIIEKSVI